MRQELELTRMEYQGLTIVIGHDENPGSPREWDNLGTIYSNHRRYDPDGHGIRELEDWETGEIDLKDYYYMKVYAYVHGGISLSTIRKGQFADPWDSGLVGVIAVERTDPRVKDMSEEDIYQAFENEITCLDRYYNGDVLGYEIYDGDECIDSCYGFYQDEEFVLAEAKSEAEACAVA